MGAFRCSEEAILKNKLFEEADQAYKQAWEEFETQNQTYLDRLDKLREDRNVKLDEVRRILRAEAEALDITKNKSFKEGKFSVVKKWSSFYQPQKLVAGLKDRGLYDSALAAKIVAEQIVVAKFEEVQNFLEKHNILRDFEDCEDGEELTPAVTGPKPVQVFGSETKDAK